MQLVHSYVIRFIFIAPETLQSLEATENGEEDGWIKKSLFEQFQLKHNYTLREVHQQLINTKLKRSKSHFTCQER